ncbi:MAG TPA: ABC transporter substrate-binding protein [Burkholderiales bacterium]|nr:ABC transporter substrate-binding protein [Burkholderiales bacterium]
MGASSMRRIVLAALAFAALGARAGTLVVNANTSDPAPRAAWEAAVQHFQREHPEVEVRLNVYDHESYKKAIRNWLTAAPPDVVFWFAGNRMRQFVAPGLLAEVSELYTPEVRAQLHPSALGLIGVGGRQYGVPYTYYPVGLYYRRDLVAAPRTWSELLAACERLAAQGLEPIAIGTRELWPAAAWFDYINLRLNGYAFHMRLMDGRVPYTDERVRAVFAHWRELLERRCFSRNHASSTWQESQALLYQGKSAMMLIGHYIVPQMPEAAKAQMDFTAFPAIRAGAGRAEEAPMNTLHIPARARNKEDARKFLAFVLRADVQQALNQAMLQIPVNLQARPADERFVRLGRTHLAQAEHLSQYFDRDTTEDLAQVAMKGFQEFMLHPQRLDGILQTIEQSRQRIYGR